MKTILKYKALKSKKIIYFISIICLCASNSYAQNWTNGKLYGGPGQEIINTTFTDASGNMYLLGTTGGNSGLLSPNVSVPAGFFISKINSADQTVWTKDGDMSSDYSSMNLPYFAAYTITQNNIGNEFYVAGGYTGSVTFGSGFHVTPANKNGMFINKYDTSGNLLSTNTTIIDTKTAGVNLPFVAPYKIKILTNGDILICGTLAGDTVVIGGTTYIFNSWDSHAFALLCNSNGNVINQIITPTIPNLFMLDDSYTDVQTDNSNNIYLLGMFNRYQTTSTTTRDIVVTKCNSSLQSINTQTLVTSYNPTWGSLCSMAVKNNGEFYVTGYAGQDSLVFATTTLYKNRFGVCNFIAGYNSLGVEQWVDSVAGFPNNILLHSVNQSLYVSGQSDPQIQFGSIPTTGSIFIANYLSNGTFNTVNFSSMNYTCPVWSTALFEGDSGAIYLAGTIRDSLSIGNTTFHNTTPIPGSCPLVDAFVIKFQPDVVASGISASEMENTIEIYPNPNNGQFTVNFDADIEVKSLCIKNIVGEVVYGVDGNNLGSQNFIDVSFLSAGTYFVTIEAEEKLSTAKIVIY